MSQYTASIQSLYVAYFNRPADPSGLAYWETIVAAAKGNTAAVSAEFAKSPEYKAAYAGLNDDAVINQVYLNIFGRAADLAGLNFWSPKLTAKLVTLDQIVTEVAKGAQGSDATTYNNRVTASTAYTDALNADVNLRLAYSNAAAITSAKSFLNGITTDASLTAAIAPAALAANLAQMVLDAAPIGSTFNLTAGVDTIVGTANIDTVNATLGTLSGFDAIDGGAGKDTLNLTDLTLNGTSSIAPSVVIKNVEIINLSSSQAVGINTTGYAGVTALNIQSTGADTVTAATTTSVNVMDTAGDVTVNGGNNVGVTTTAGNVSVGATTKAVGNVTVATNGTGLTGIVTIVGGKNIVSTSANNVDISKVTGTVAVTTTTTAGTISVKGGTDVSIVSKANSGNVNVGAAAVVTVATADVATGKQTISNLADIATGTVTIANSTTTTAGVTTYGTSATNVYTNGAASVSISGAGATTIVDVGTVPLIPATAGTAVAGTSKLASVSLTGVSGTSTVASDVLTNLALTKVSAGVTATVVGAHALTVASAGNTGSVTDNTATAVTINTSGTAADALALSATKAVSLTIGGSGAAFSLNGATLVLGATAGASSTAAATSVTVIGSVAASLGDLSAQSKLTGVDATANTGGVAATMSLTASFTGGTGADVVTVGATTKAILTGDGNDTVIMTSGTVGTGGSIVGGAGVDTLSISAAAAVTASATNVFASKVNGFEHLTLTGATNQTVDLTVLGNYNYVSTTGGNGLVLSNLVSGSTLALTGAGTAYTIDSGSAFIAGANDTINIALTDGSGSGVSFASSGVTATNVENIVITTADTQAAPAASAGGFNDGLKLVGDFAKSITVSGNAGLTLVATDTAATSIDASGITLGGFSFTSGVLLAAATIKGSATGLNGIDFSAATKAVTYVGGSGVDNVVVTNANNNIITLGEGATNSVTGGGNGNNTITGGAKDDTVVVGSGNNTVSLGNGVNAFTAGNGNNTYVGGTGVDTIIVGGGANTITTGTGNDSIKFTAASANGNSYSTIMDAHAGVTIDFGSGASLNAVALTLAGTAVFQDFLDAATAGITSTVGAGALSYFVLGGNTYVVADHSAATTFQNGVDSVVKLVGIVDLTVANTFSAGIVTLH